MTGIAFLDVGQADSVVLTLPDGHSAIVVDSSRDLTTLRFLLDKGIERVPLALITHMHHDHIGRMLDLVTRFKGAVGMLMCNVDRTLPADADDEVRWRTTLRDLAGRERAGLACPDALAPWTQECDGICLTLLHPARPDVRDALADGCPNNASVVIRVQYQGRSVLLPGDLQKRGWGWLLQRDPDVSADVLKFPHHGGSYLGDDEDAEGPELTDVVARVSPEVVVISVGTNNVHGHPLPESFACVRAARPNARVLCTQVTPRCMPDVAGVRDQAMALVAPENANGNSYHNPNACPCAGTVVVQISEDGLTVLPTAEQQAPIRELFATPQCIDDMQAM